MNEAVTQRDSEMVEDAWWVRLGSTQQGPVPWETLRTQRSAGLLSRWHEVSRDGQHWEPIDEVGEADSMDLIEKVVDEPDADTSLAWAELAATNDLDSKAGEPRSDATIRIAMGSAAFLWLALLAVPLGWWQGNAVHAWSWPAAFESWGIVFATWWWALAGVFAATFAAQPTFCGFMGAHSWRSGLAGWLVVGGLGLLLFGPNACRIAVGFVWMPGLAICLAWRGVLKSWVWSVGSVVVAGGVYVMSCWGMSMFGHGAETLPVDPVEAALLAAGRTHGVMAAVYLCSHLALLAWAWPLWIGIGTKQASNHEMTGASQG